MAYAYNQVDGVLDSQSIIVRLDPEHGFKMGDKVAILSREDIRLVALGKVVSVNSSVFPEAAKVEIIEVVGPNIIMAGNAVEKLTVQVLEAYHVPGHFSLVVKDEASIPARYKDLAYMGVFNSDGHALADGEWLLSFPQVQYGMSDNFTVKVLTGLFLDGFANVGGKLRLMNNSFGRLTLNGLASRQVDSSDWAFLTGFVLTMPSNEKFQTHLVVNVNVEDIEDQEHAESEKLNLFPDSDIRTIYEYVTDDWNRFLFGPLFNFETQTVGGTVSYMWIWDTFHLNIGLATKDVSKFEFGEDGYYPLFDFFWRF